MTTQQAAPSTTVKMAWLEITPNCQLSCRHCYAGSGPGLGHGIVPFEKWQETITSLHAMGVGFVQFIGGEPTTHPRFCELVEFAAQLGLEVEVYSNLVSITERMWQLFVRHRVQIGTSFYTPDPMLHTRITNSPHAYQKTLGNIQKALSLGLRLRVGMVRVTEEQNIAEAKELLTQLGVKRIGVDRARGVGRGANIISESSVSALCGSCITGRCAITASGDVFPCIMARAFPVGNILQSTIEEILRGDTFRITIDRLSAAFATRTYRCEPDECKPDVDPDPLDCDPECDPKAFPPCSPDCCPETVADCEPTEA